MVRVGIDIHCIGQRQTGNETYIRELVGALATLHDPDVDFVLYHSGRHATADASGRAAHPSGPGTRSAGAVRRLWPAPPAIRIPLSMPIACYRDGVDVTHVQYVAPPVSPSRSVVTVHDISFATHPEFLPRALVMRMRWLVGHSMRNAAHVITLSEFTRQAICDRYGLRADRITVTPAAAAPQFRRLEAATVSAYRTTLGLPDHFILAVGNLQPRKNLGTLLEAYARLPRRRRQTHKLVLVGQAHHHSGQVFEAMQRLGIASDVRWTGYVPLDALVAIYNLADLFVFPSFYEGFGLPVIEAMACGVPVVSANASCLPEVCGDAALLVNPRDAGEMSAAIETAIDSAPLRAALTARGLHRAAGLSWMATARQTIEVYKACS